MYPVLYLLVNNSDPGTATGEGVHLPYAPPAGGAGIPHEGGLPRDPWPRLPSERVVANSATNAWWWVLDGEVAMDAASSLVKVGRGPVRRRVSRRRPGAMFCCTGRVAPDHHTAGHGGGGGLGIGRLLRCQSVEERTGTPPGSGKSLLQWAARLNTRSQVTLRARPPVGDTEEVADAKSRRKSPGDEPTSHCVWELFQIGRAHV